MVNIDDESNKIYFYDLSGKLSKPENEFLNNFYPSEFISTKDLRWKSVEHYYQAHKFGDNRKEGFDKIFQEIYEAGDADICKKISRKYTHSLKPEEWDKENWDKNLKEYYMKRGLTYKYSQNIDLLKKLLSTGDKVLIEESEKDAYWGGLTKGSLNRLGEMLMELRENYRKTRTVYLDGSNIKPIPIEFDDL